MASEKGEHPEAPDPRLVKAVWAAVGVVFIVLSAIVYRAYLNRPVQLSADIFDHGAEDAAFRPDMSQTQRDAHALPGGAVSLGLRQGLRMAKMVIPDRPHDPEELGKPPDAEDEEESTGFARRRGFTISTNSQGLRIPDSSQSDSPVYRGGADTDFRIVCLGDSISFGWGVSYEESFPATLARELGVSVVNASAPAARQEGLARWAKQKLLELRPNLVILALRPEYLVEDPLQDFKAILTELSGVSGDIPLLVVLPPLSTFNVQLPLIKKLYPGSTDIIQADVQAIGETLAPIPVLGLTKPFREAQRTYQSSASEVDLVTLVEENGVQRLLSAQGHAVVEALAPEQPEEGEGRKPEMPRDHRRPGPDHLGGPPPLQGQPHLNEEPPPEDPFGLTELNFIMDDPDPAPERPVNRRMVIASDIYAAFEKNTDLREPYFFDGAHPDSEGYALFGKIVAEWLIEHQLVPDHRPAADE